LKQAEERRKKEEDKRIQVREVNEIMTRRRSLEAYEREQERLRVEE
jgi:hypothetical protein